MISEHKNRSKAVTIALVVLIGVLCVLPARGQVIGATLSGQVTDPSGGSVPNAKVSIQNRGTGEVRAVTTNNDGYYAAPNLTPGSYTATFSASGFSTIAQKGIVLTVGTQQTLNIALKVGEVSQTVEVTDAPEAVQTTSTISAVVDARTIRELPLNGRDWTSLATLEPGVTSIPNQVGTGFSANKGNRGFGNQLSNGGQRANQNTYRVNGISVNDYSNGAPGGASGLNLGVDGIQEFSVLTSNYTAEYGRTSGAVINAINKSGENAFHGSGFFFDRDKIFDAKNYFDSATAPIPSFRRIQFGASGGTAIIKDKTFVYGSYEGVRQNRPGSQAIHVPTAAQRALAVPAVAPYLALWPLAPAGTAVDANGITQTFNVALPSISNENYYSFKVDHKISSADSLTSSYFWDSGPQSQPDPLQNAIHQVFSRRQMFSIDETHIFTPAVINTFRVGISRVRGDINNPVSGDAVATDASLAVAPGAAAPPQISVNGLTTAIGLGGLNRFRHRWTSGQLYDDAFYNRGTHAIKIGFAFERMRYNILEQLSPNGRMNAYTTLAQLLSNTTKRLNALAPGQSNEVAIRESLVAGYIQDDWHWRPNFTVNMGVRYEFTTLPTDANNRIQEITTLVGCATPGVAPSPTSPCGPVHVNSFIASNPTTKDFEPRVGFSWDPFKDGKTAVRAGFGMFDVLPLPYEFGLNTSATAPYQIVGFDNNGKLGGGIDPNVSFNPNNVRNRYIQQDPSRAYVMNWNFNVQREIGTNWRLLVGYVGSRSLHLSVAGDDINLVPPVQTAAGIMIPSNTYQLDPNWGGGNGGVIPGAPGGAGIRPVIFDGASSYRALQMQLKRSMSHGLQGQISYTWGTCKDNSSAPVTGDTYVNSVAVPLLLSKQYRQGACDFDIRHTLVGTGIWDVPGPKTGVASYIIGGWELGTILTATSGSPYTVTIGGGGDPLATGFNGDFSMDFPNLVPGCNATPGVFRNASGKLMAFDPTCFVAAPAVAGGVLVGNAGRNAFYGPGLTTVDFSAFKNVPVTERVRLQFRAEFFNLLNHPNFAAPNFLNDANNSIGTATAGVIGSTSTSSRQVQLGAKIVW
jgi:hypothetical protein